MIPLLLRPFRRVHGKRQRGITGTEMAIVIASGAAVVATMAVTLFAAATGGGGGTVYAGLDEATAGLEPRGGVVGFTGTGADGETVVYKIAFVVAGAPGAEPVDFTGAYGSDGRGLDPDPPVAPSGVTVSYTGTDGSLVEDVPWSVSFLGYSDGDLLLEENEKAQFSVWLQDRNNDVDIQDAGALVTREDGSSPQRPLRAGDAFTIRVSAPDDQTLSISRTAPVDLTPVLDLG